MTRATLDSNVYVSAFVFGGKPGRVIEMATEGAVDVTVSDAIVAEVRRVLLTKFGWSVERAAEVVETIRDDGYAYDDDGTAGRCFEGP